MTKATSTLAAAALLSALGVAIVLSSQRLTGGGADDDALAEQIAEHISIRRPLPQVTLPTSDGMGISVYERAFAAAALVEIGRPLSEQMEAELVDDINTGLAMEGQEGFAAATERVLHYAVRGLSVEAQQDLELAGDATNQYADLDAYDRHYHGLLTSPVVRERFPAFLTSARGALPNDCSEHLGPVLEVEDADLHPEFIAATFQTYEGYGLDCGFDVESYLADFNDQYFSPQGGYDANMESLAFLAARGLYPAEALRPVLLGPWSDLLDEGTQSADTIMLSHISMAYGHLGIEVPEMWSAELIRRLSTGGDTASFESAELLLDAADAYLLLDDASRRDELVSAIDLDRQQPYNLLAAEVLATGEVSPDTIGVQLEAGELNPRLLWFAVERNSETCAALAPHFDALSPLIEEGLAADNVYVAAIAEVCFDARSGEVPLVTVDLRRIEPEEAGWQPLAELVRWNCAAVNAGLVDGFEPPVIESSDVDSRDFVQLTSFVLVAEVGKRGCSVLEEL